MVPEIKNEALSKINGLIDVSFDLKTIEIASHKKASKPNLWGCPLISDNIPKLRINDSVRRSSSVLKLIK